MTAVRPPPNLSTACVNASNECIGPVHSLRPTYAAARVHPRQVRRLSHLSPPFQLGATTSTRTNSAMDPNLFQQMQSACNEAGWSTKLDLANEQQPFHALHIIVPSAADDSKYEVRLIGMSMP